MASLGETSSAATALAMRAPSTCTSRSSAWAWSTNSLIVGAVQTRPFSVDWVIDTIARLGVVDLAAPGRPAVEFVGRDQAVVAGQSGELGAGQSDGSAGLVEQDVGDVAAEDLVPRPDRRRQRDDVGRGAGEREQHVGVGGVESRPERVRQLAR